MESTTAYPFPTVARLALSLYASDRAVERLPRITEFLPCELVYLVRTVETTRKGDWL